MTRAVLAALLSAWLGAGTPASDGRVYRGSERELAVGLPRLDAAEIVLDGTMDEPEWAEAALLSAFTQVEPVEGAPASERTEVRIFYTPSALYIGIRAYTSQPSRLRATLAERDRILRDDHVQILLDTFNDRRRAYAFYVNPFGIQQDGIHTEGAGRRGSERVDFSPDFLFQSRGRLTGDGYVVEVHIPFKSLKFASAARGDWGLNVIRSIAATGAEESWAPLTRNDPSRLAQSGTLVGLRDLRPGMLVEVNPTLTGRRDGTVRDGALRHGPVEPDAGLNLRWGVSSNLTLDATVNPDFSQVEADAGQITANERFAISLAEKRPFFLEGAEVFSTPEPLVYTRAIVNPVAGAKLTGKVGAYGIGYLGALDESPLTGGTTSYAPRRERALFQLVRVQRDVGRGSSVGLLVTDREAGDEFNRVAGVDGRFRFRRVYSWQVQAAGSSTRAWEPTPGAADTAAAGGVAVAPVERTGALLSTSLDRTGRSWGFRFGLRDVPDGFQASGGFLRRTGVTELSGLQRMRFFGGPGALLETATVFVSGNRIHDGRGFWKGADAVEGSTGVRSSLALRGNTRVQVGYTDRFFVLDPERYARYALTGTDGAVRTGEDLIRGRHRLDRLGGLSVDVESSRFKTVSLGAEAGWEATPIFAEGTRGEALTAAVGAALRPTDALRVEANLRHARLFRAEDGSLFSEALIPRLRVEYQLTREVFVRAVGQYNLEETDLLRAPDGTPYLYQGAPLRVRRGRISAADAPQTNPLRLDLLFSYQPSPGTVVFLGYGSEMTDREAFRFAPLARRADGFFLKLSYLFRS
jgi:hypothetical protein